MAERLSDTWVNELARWAITGDAHGQQRAGLLAREVQAARKLRAALLAIDPDAGFFNDGWDDYGIGYDAGWQAAVMAMRRLIQEADDE